MPDSLSAEAWERVFELVGFYRWPGAADQYFYNSDAKRRLGPPAVYFDAEGAVELPVGVVRRYLIEQGFNGQALDRAISAVMGDPDDRS